MPGAKALHAFAGMLLKETTMDSLKLLALDTEQSIQHSGHGAAT